MMHANTTGITKDDLIRVIEYGGGVEFGNWDALSARPAWRFRAMREAQELGA